MVCACSIDLTPQISCCWPENGDTTCAQQQHHQCSSELESGERWREQRAAGAALQVDGRPRQGWRTLKGPPSASAVGWMSP